MELSEERVASRRPARVKDLRRRFEKDAPAAEPIRDVRGGFDAALLKVWKPSRPGEKKPRFHDLRKTGATRVESISSHAVAKAFLGHSDEDVTDSYIQPGLEAVRGAINRAARLIDGGEPPAGVLIFRPKMAHQTAHPPRKRPSVAASRKGTIESDPLISKPLAASITLPAKVAELIDAQRGARGSPPNRSAGTCAHRFLDGQELASYDLSPRESGGTGRRAGFRNLWVTP
jgi:hypothetical protein